MFELVLFLLLLVLIVGFFVHIVVRGESDDPRERKPLHKRLRRWLKKVWDLVLSS